MSGEAESVSQQNSSDVATHVLFARKCVFCSASLVVQEKASLGHVFLILLVNKIIRHACDVVANHSRQRLLPGFLAITRR
jgi:hypothetical protein